MNFIFLVLIFVALSSTRVVASNYYSQNNKYYSNSYYSNKYSNNNKNTDDGGTDDANESTDDAANEDSSGNDDGANANNQTDDNSSNNGNNNNSGNGNSSGNNYSKYSSSSYSSNKYSSNGDDTFRWGNNVGFDGVSIMPMSCVNFRSGHMIKFTLFNSANSLQCHRAEISSFIVSVAHYMRAYFNYRALTEGQNFKLPSDAGYLNCVKLKYTVNNMPLYGKIGCLHRDEMPSSIKLQLHVYTDSQCSQIYDDSRSTKEHATEGYKVGKTIIPTQVSFRVPFFKCAKCKPDQISQTFSKQLSAWYDDDYIVQQAMAKQNKNQNQNQQQQQQQQAADDATTDDQYFAANDDLNDDASSSSSNNNNAYSSSNNNNNAYNNKYSNGNYKKYNYGYNNNGYNRGYSNNYGGRSLAADENDLQAYQEEFWGELDEMQNERALYSSPVSWNICQRLYKYGASCDKECQALDYFRANEWSKSDKYLMGSICSLITVMIAYSLYHRHKASKEGLDPLPGFPSVVLFAIFLIIIAGITVLANLRFVNEALIFAVVSSALLFLYVLKLTYSMAEMPCRTIRLIDVNPLDDHLMT